MSEDLAINRAILDSMRQEIERVVGLEIEKAQAEIARRVRSHVGAITTTILRDVTFENFGRDLRITVRFPEGTKP